MFNTQACFHSPFLCVVIYHYHQLLGCSIPLCRNLLFHLNDIINSQWGSQYDVTSPILSSNMSLNSRMKENVVLFLNELPIRGPVLNQRVSSLAFFSPLKLLQLMCYCVAEKQNDFSTSRSLCHFYWLCFSLQQLTLNCEGTNQKYNIYPESDRPVSWEEEVTLSPLYDQLAKGKQT